MECDDLAHKSLGCHTCGISDVIPLMGGRALIFDRRRAKEKIPRNYKRSSYVLVENVLNSRVHEQTVYNTMVVLRLPLFCGL
jgi:hypothetical protein